MQTRHKRIQLPLFCWVAITLASVTGWTLPARAVFATETRQLSESATKRVEELVAIAIADKKMPGCVIGVGDSKGLFFLHAYGNKRTEPTPEPMTVDTVFDMASITKPVATGSSIMKLIEQGKLRPQDKVVDFFPDFGVKDKDEITILDLLVHRSGLIPDNALADYKSGPEVAWQKICDLPLTAPVGTAFKYSDVNFIVLGKVVEKLSGKDLNQFVRSEVFEPCGMQESGFLPPEPLKQRAAPTEKRNEVWIQGEVHDPRAYELGGIAGHAGLFSTAEDISQYAQMVLNSGRATRRDGSVQQVFAPGTLRLMGRGVPVPGGIRGLSWDKQTGFSTNKGNLLSSDAIGHGGFTGTVLWIDPAQDLFFVFLSNRVHPDGKGLVNPLSGKLLNVVASDLARATRISKDQHVLSGLDCLERDGFRALDGRKVGLITNHTARTRSKVGIVKLFAEAKNFQLASLFSPEHGFEGKLDISKVGDSQDASTGLKIYSLYGETRRPTPAMLESVDTLVFDIQDIGARFYTYISTMGEAMRAASENKKRFVVLDRPNPINGVDVAGPMLDDKLESFVAYHKLPVRHGMSVGEIAKMLKAELNLELDLVVVPCEGWERSMYYESTGIPWINPSPNMRSLNQALLYPGIGLLETTNISVGRGTDTPFEWIGAPWMRASELAAELNRVGLPGVVFLPVEFTPDSSKFAKELCQGIQIDVIDRSAFQPVQTGLMIAVQLRKLHPKDWETKSLNRLLGNKAMEQAILDGKDWEEMEKIYLDGMSEFLKRREAFLLYR
ncbi:Penicillin-binding protein 4* [Pirellula sp. SH-Sr6A]|uniref:exo-beta-N-acetylmuramidase NamZ domain-containing protein n=1 Tax=Pirellula sp. SH-Sr6A TaxID=1632865 RepID=UPI00078E5670|nr:exo-beta-N-acetylmuramidase NamZ domain-containing protein [Pirellula sp. SH-Sr6A]AMV31128.1 Penicillin-binding protein 4* [Pirellula sp. SH-Sr6A]